MLFESSGPVLFSVTLAFAGLHWRRTAERDPPPRQEPRDESARDPHARTLVLVQEGALCPDALRCARVTVNAVECAVRSSGLASIEDAWAVVLEPDGNFRVLRRPPRTRAMAGAPE